MIATTTRTNGLPARNSIGWDDGKIRFIDQRLLPAQYRIVETNDWRTMVEAIRTLAVRGAPLIGISAAYAVAVAAVNCGERVVANQESSKTFLSDRDYLQYVIDILRVARPTAVNLGWALNRMQLVLDHVSDPRAEAEQLVAEAVSIHKDDQERCTAIGVQGQCLISDQARILTVCNTGFLATGGSGTAAAVFYEAFDRGLNIEVLACETRPLLQGARLTVWEMSQAGIPVTLMVDSAAAGLAAQGQIELCIIGADRVAANGDVANKIGSYQLALACHAHQIPFYVAAPFSTIDPDCPDGAAIPIEQRTAEEVTTLNGTPVSANPGRVYNPAFDRVPSALISGIITERGIYRPAYNFSQENILCS